MFKFRFTTEDFEEDFTDEADQMITKEQINEHVTWAESEEITPDNDVDFQYLSSRKVECGDFTIAHISPEDVVESLKRTQSGANSVLSAEQNHSDLVTGVYEGGLKVWECTYDLVNFINKTPIDVSGKRVLDLGCGAGILGILASLKGATSSFQDYNSEVVKHITIPNVSLNLGPQNGCKFYSGDWGSFADLLENKEKFDLIFTSETIYNPENYLKLHKVFEKLLSKSGTIYLAAKSYYFGVGGGIAQFEDLLKTLNIFNCTTCWNCSEGVKRAIIKINFK